MGAGGGGVEAVDGKGGGYKLRVLRMVEPAVNTQGERHTLLTDNTLSTPGLPGRYANFA